MEQVSILIVHEDFSIFSTNEQLPGGGRPANKFNGYVVFFSPFAIPLNASNDDISVLVGDAYLGAIGAPFHVLDGGHFSIVDHFFDPLAIVFHKNDDGSGGIAGSQLTIFVIPDDIGNVARVIRQVCALVSLGVVPLHFQTV